jgi:hypothetical protein
MPNLLPELLPDFAHLAPVLHVADVPASTGGLVLRVLFNGDIDRAVGYLAPAEAMAQPVGAERRREPGSEDHWRWRLRMAEQVGAALDPQRFGVQALYLVGSTKNAMASASSDIDLVVHFTGTARQRAALEQWLEGWSLCLAEMNFLRTGCRSRGLLDVHVVTDDDVARRSGYAVKIGAATDPARPLPLGSPARG